MYHSNALYTPNTAIYLKYIQGKILIFTKEK